MHHLELECNAKTIKNIFCCVKGQGLGKGLIKSKSEFLLYILNHWSFCNQTYLDGTSSEDKLACEKIRLLCSRSRSQQRFKISVNVCLDDKFLNCPATKPVILMYHHEPKFHWKWFTVFMAKVTIRAHHFYNQIMAVLTSTVQRSWWLHVLYHMHNF